MPVRAVIDTSALVPPDTRRTLQELAQRGIFTAIWSPWIVAELNRVLTWYWIRRVRPQDMSLASERACSRAAHTMMTLLFATFELVHPEPPYPAAWDGLTDAWDMPVWPPHCLQTLSMWYQRTRTTSLHPTRRTSIPIKASNISQATTSWRC